MLNKIYLHFVLVRKLLSHCFIKKKSKGDIVITSVRLSVCPSVGLSVRMLSPKTLDEIQPNLVCELLT